MLTRLIVVIMYTNTKSFCCTPEANIMLYVNYTSILKKKRKKESDRGSSFGINNAMKTSEGYYTSREQVPS